MMAGMVRDIGLLQVLLHGLTMPNLSVAERASLPAGELSVEDMQRVPAAVLKDLVLRAYSGPNFVHQVWIVSYVFSIPRSATSSSISRNESVNR